MKISTVNPFNDRNINKLRRFFVPLLPALIFLLLATNLTTGNDGNGTLDLANAAPTQQEGAVSSSSDKHTAEAGTTQENKEGAPESAAQESKEGASEADATRENKDALPDAAQKEGEEDKDRSDNAKSTPKEQTLADIQREADQKKAEQVKLARQFLAQETEKKRKEAAELTQNSAWKDIWKSEKGRIDYAIENAKKITEIFNADILVLKKIYPLEEDVRRLIVMADNFKTWPTPLEAVNYRLSISLDAIQSIVASASTGLTQARKSLSSINRMAEALKFDPRAKKEGEVHEFAKQIHEARFQLSAIIARYSSALAPARGLVEKIQAKRQEIDTRLPPLWKEHYMQGPFQWTSIDEWKKIPVGIKFFGLCLEVRRPIEIPANLSQWQTTIIRFVVTFLSLAVISVLAVNALLKDAPKCRSHILKWSMPWNVIGLSLLAASFTSTLAAYRLFLAAGYLFLVTGQISLAWDLRKLDFPNVTEERSPLLPLLPLITCAYILLYMPLLRTAVFALWTLCLIVAITACRRRKPLDLPGMHIEKTISDIEPLVLWPCLALSLFGLDIASMLAYLLFASLCVSVQLATGSLSFLSKLSRRLPNDRPKYILAGIVIAFSAPAILMMAVCAVLLWIGTLPGGIYIIQDYIFTNISVGQSRFNPLQLLLIVTAFFLSRTIAGVGKKFIVKLPSNTSMNMDSSLVTPMQTAFVYLVWTAFGLFTLKSLGMNLDNIAVIAGGLSVGIGFGMQTIVSNFISGLILIFGRSLQVGDVVEVAGILGTIKKITVRATVIETGDLATIYVPNSELVSGRLKNWTSNGRSVRREILVSVSCANDPGKVSRLLVSTAEKEENVMAAPRPTVLFTDFGASKFDFKLRYWVKETLLSASTASRLRYAISNRFKEEGIDIAFNQVYVHMDKSGEQQTL